MKFSVKILTIVMVQKTPFLITELILMAATAWNIGLVLLAVAPCIHTVAFMLMMYAVLCRKMQSQSAFCPHQAGKVFWPFFGLFLQNLHFCRSRCGKKGFDSGHEGEADMAEWPWHAAILEKPQDLYVCGSTLLDESWILTAAHCVDD